MRQQAGSGSKVRPKLEDQQGRGKGPLRQWERVWGDGRMGGVRSEDGARTERISESKTSAIRGVGRGPGRERDRVRAELSSHLPPPGVALAGTQQPGPTVPVPPPQQLASGSHSEFTHRRASTSSTEAHSQAWRKSAQVEHA